MYPVVFIIPRPEKTSRLLMIFRFFLIIPVAFFGGLYSIPVSAVMLVAFWAILFTGKYPRSMWEYVTRYFRFNTNLNAYFMLLTDAYPPFNGKAETPYPIKTTFAYPERMSRLALLFRWLIMFPHYFYVMIYSIGYLAIAFLNFWAVLFMGKIPEGFFSFLKRYFIYSYRLNAYMYVLTDEYPPFNGHQPQAAGETIPVR